MQSLQKEISSSANYKQGSPLSAVSTSVGGVLDTVFSGSRESLSPSFIYALQLADHDSVAWLKGFSGSLSEDGALLGLWLSFSPEEVFSQLSNQFSKPFNGGRFYSLMEQNWRTSKEAMDIYGSISKTRLSGTQVFTESSLFKMFLAKLLAFFQKRLKKKLGVLPLMEKRFSLAR